ncbi:DMT family transporter [Gemelliphila palaticanis]|uniref:DMT family transporter n=1 Tax=Gemelliphila palaticanis TaxID=81950 RepID=A0ABX2SZL5_9BACL|nr:DMT family transporter [Gemella palaticanis]MBF0715883.1 DMT family transporter [Gemella palaticanis]NYS47813.1 DMT family transporter [Gemella palaticanis]
MRKFISEILLLIVTIIWGLAFVWQSIASKHLGPLTVVGFRSGIAVIFLFLVVLIFPFLYKSQEPKFGVVKSKSRSIILSISCGLALFFAMYIQQIGLAYTTASKAGFITVLYICIVPLMGLILGHKINKYFLIGLILSVVGLYLLSIKGDFTLEYGDLLVLISAILFALHIIVIDYAVTKVNAMYLSIGQLIVVSVLSLSIAAFKEGYVLSNIMEVLPSLIALGVLSSGVAYTLQIIAQRNIPAHTASLIMSLESVVAAIGGVIILGEILSTREVIGMVVVFVGIIISQKK